ncbi:Gp37 family protein [Geobacter sp.]|uniref:Gp37 family protein n=1 Tax=Geobacter sp. TaxID=46610 RepID=UPI00262EBB9C|nr:Gp37 family protein [Geobacter sp.]
MDILSPVEDAIIARLKAQLPAILVQPYPDNPEIWEPTHPVGALLVRYSDGEYSLPRDTGVVVQERDLMFEITLALWSLRGKSGQGGLYSYLEAVRVALTGFVPPHCSRKMTPVAEEFVGRGGGLKNKSQRLWQYAITFKTSTLNIEVLEEEQAPLLARITAIDEQLNQTTEVP